MDKERFQQAINLYNSGDKKVAETILWQLTSRVPADANVWYGLALCAQVDNERVERLQKCLEIDPGHVKARKALAILQERQKPQQAPKPIANIPTSSIEDLGTGIPSDEKKSDSTTGINFSPHWFYVPTIFILICFTIWQLVRIDRLEKSMAIMNGDIRTQSTSIDSTNSDVRFLKTDIDSTNSDVQFLKTDIDSAKSNIHNLGVDIASIKSNIGTIASGIDTNSSNIRTLAAGLDYVTPLAKNANQYAHSHNTFSDARLKTDIVEIDNPLTKVLQLRGVYYRWDTTGHPNMGFNNRLQIGVIAQEVEAVFPELVTTDISGYKQVDYEKLSAVLIEAIKEQEQEITGLDNRVNQLEGK